MKNVKRNQVVFVLTLAIVVLLVGCTKEPELDQYGIYVKTKDGMRTVLSESAIDSKYSSYDEWLADPFLIRGNLEITVYSDLYSPDKVTLMFEPSNKERAETLKKELGDKASSMDDADEAAAKKFFEDMMPIKDIKVVAPDRFVIRSTENSGLFFLGLGNDRVQSDIDSFVRNQLYSFVAVQSVEESQELYEWYFKPKRQEAYNASAKSAGLNARFAEEIWRKKHKKGYTSSLEDLLTVDKNLTADPGVTFVWKTATESEFEFTTSHVKGNKTFVFTD